MNSRELNSPIGPTTFLWTQALWLPTWAVHVFPTQEQESNILKVAPKLQAIQALYPGRKIMVTSWLRPDLYNEWEKPYGVGGALGSFHPKGGAVDFIVPGVACDEVRAMLEPKLEELQIRMENLPEAGWVHIDVAPVVYSRFFKP